MSDLSSLIRKAEKERQEQQMMRDVGNVIDEIHDLKKRVRRLESMSDKRRRWKRSL